MSCIYKLTNQVTGMVYVGKTSKTLTERFTAHQRNSITLNTYLYRAMRLYGIDAFVPEIIEMVDDDTLGEREQHWIVTLDTMVPNGYNMTSGGDGGDTSTSPNYIAGMKKRDYTGSNNPNYGKLGVDSPNYGSKRTITQKENLRNGLSKAWKQNTTRKQLASDRMSGEQNHMFGRMPPNAMRVVFNGKMYDSLSEAARDTGWSPAYIKKYGETTNDQ